MPTTLMRVCEDFVKLFVLSRKNLCKSYADSYITVPVWQLKHQQFSRLLLPLIEELIHN